MSRPRHKKSVSPAELFAILERAFESARPAQCRDCRVPLPFRVSRAKGASSNWKIGPARECAQECDALISAIAAQLGSQYDLEEPRFSHAHDEGRRLH